MKITVLTIVLLVIMMPICSIDASTLPKKNSAVALGTLGGMASFGNDINDRGQVVGASFTSESPYYNWHAFTWTKGKGMTDLNPTNSLYSQAKAINDKGDIVGYFYPEDAIYDRSCLWKANGEFVDLGALWGGPETCAYARDINNNGLIAGTGYTYEDIMAPSYFVGHAVIWFETDSGYVCQDIGTLEGGDMAWAYGVNDRGEVVGMSAIRLDPNGPMEYHAFVWTMREGMKDLGNLGDQLDQEMCIATNINDRGQIVGHYLLLDEWGVPTFLDQGFKTTGKVTGLAPIEAPNEYPHSYASGINARGVVAGGVWIDEYYNTRHAAIWTAKGICIDLGTLPDGSDSWAQNVNDNGVVVGTSSGSTDYGWWGYQATIWNT